MSSQGIEYKKGAVEALQWSAGYRLLNHLICILVANSSNPRI